jgi:hypothetical protein
MTPRNESTTLRWLTLFGATALAITASELIGLAQHWKDGVVYTVVVFVAVILAFRRSWARATFWRSLVYIFVGHTILVVVAVQTLPHGRFGFPKLLLVPIGGAEGVLIAALLWRRIAALRALEAGARKGRSPESALPHKPANRSVFH